MKLPGTNYGRGTEALAKFDTNLPYEVAQEKMRANQAATEVLSSASKATSYIYNQESLRQVDVSLPSYIGAMKEQIATTQAYDEEGVGIWENSDKKYAEFQQKAMESVQGAVKTPLANQMMRQKARELNSSLMPQWAAMVQEKQREVDLAAYSDGAEKLLQEKQFDMARSSTDSALYKNLISDTQHQKIKAGIDYQEVDHNIVTDINKRTKFSYDGKDVLKLRNKINDNKVLSARDKTKNVALMEGNIVNNAVSDYNDELNAVKETSGLFGAYVRGKEILDNMKFIDPEQFGGDIEFRHKIRTRLSAELAHWQVDLAKLNGQREILDWVTQVTGDQFNDPVTSAIDNMTLGRMPNKTNGYEPGTGMTDTELAENKDNRLLGDIYDNTIRRGRVSPYIEKFVSSQLENPISQKAEDAAVEFVTKLYNNDPDAMKWQSSEYHLDGFNQYLDFYGTSPQGSKIALRAWRSWKKNSQDAAYMEERTAYKKYADTDTFYYDEIDSALNGVFGKGQGFIWGDASVEMVDELKTQTFSMYNHFITAGSDKTEALQLATNSLKFKYGESSVNENQERALTQFPMEKVVKTPLLSEAQRATALNQQVLDTLKAAGQENKNFDIVPVKGMDLNRPVYQIRVMNDNGMWSVVQYAPEIQATELYVRAEQAKRVADAREQSLARMEIEGAKNLLQFEQNRDPNDATPFDQDIIDYSSGSLPSSVLVGAARATEVAEAIFGPLGNFDSYEVAAKRFEEGMEMPTYLDDRIKDSLKEDKLMQDILGGK